MARKQKFPYLLGSKWTARQITLGWRHFQVVNRKNQGKLVFAELEATCDSNIRLWVNAQALKDPDLWQPGWQTLTDIRSENSAVAVQAESNDKTTDHHGANQA